MKEFKEVFGSQMKNVYMLAENELFPLCEENDPPTVDNFKVIAVIETYSEPVALTAEDFEYYDLEEGDRDFLVSNSDDYISRNAMPDDIREFLDAVIDKRTET